MDFSVFTSIYVYDILTTFACENVSCEISGFRRGVVEVFDLLRRCAAYVDSWLPTAWPLKVGPIDSPETWLSCYQPPMRNILEHRRAYFVLFEMQTFVKTF